MEFGFTKIIFTVTGHSLGGALSSIAAIYIYHQFGKVPWLFTIGQPRTGNPDYARDVETNVSSVFKLKLSKKRIKE